jgi:ABC-type sugar transport system permease subunit
MVRKINPSEDNQIFKVRGDGTIVREDEVKSKVQSTLDKELLDIIEVNSFSKNILAAYKARKIANKISKEKYGKKNYKEYVEMLMVKFFPKELDKARLGKKYRAWRNTTIWICLIVPFSLTFLFIVVMPLRRKLKELYN